jgi:hypothetical protein
MRIDAADTGCLLTLKPFERRQNHYFTNNISITVHVNNITLNTFNYKDIMAF